MLLPPSCRRARPGRGARSSDLDGRAAETSRPDRRAAMGRSPTINVRHIDRLVVEGKASAANDGHPHEGMSLSAEQPTSLPSTMSQFPARRHFPRFIRPRERGQNRRAIRIGRRKRVRILGRTSRVLRASHFGDPFFVRRQWAAREPIASSFPSVMRGLKPNPFGQQRLRSTNFPFGYAEFLARQIRRPSPSSACAPALRVQAARAGLFCAAPRGTRWRWASGPRREKKDHRNGLQPLQVRPQA